MQKNKGQSSWISLSDLMTGLMLVFLLIVVMLQDPTRCGSTKQKIRDALQNINLQEQPDHKIELPSDKDSCGLVISFSGEQKPLFEQDQVSPTTSFQNTLNDFIPRYLEILQNKEIKDYIQEVHIEGHTGKPTPKHSTYISLVNLSQDRARFILQYFVLPSKAFRALEQAERNKLKFKLMSIGFGNGRTLDDSGQFSIESGEPPSPKSRRVEFRIVTGANHAIREAMQPK